MKQGITLIILSIFLSGCSSVASSTAAFLVAKHSEIQEVDSRRYTGSDRCMMRGKPDPFMLGQMVMTGESVPDSYQYILNPEQKKGYVTPPHFWAYAFYTVADQMGDMRAKRRMQDMQQDFQGAETAIIEKKIREKYLPSYLSKCFSTPSQYKVYIRDRDLLQQ